MTDLFNFGLVPVHLNPQIFPPLTSTRESRRAKRRKNWGIPGWLR